MKVISTALGIIALIICISCGTTKPAETPIAPQQPMGLSTVIGTGHRSTASLPKAVIYKTNGDYNQNVMVMLNDAGTEIISYPDPRDVSAKRSTPVELGDGWLLDRRGGISGRSAFLRYTYAEYAALDKAPTMAELKKAIIPDAHVTVYKVLPITVSEALAQPSTASKFIGVE